MVVPRLVLGGVEFVAYDAAFIARALVDIVSFASILILLVLGMAVIVSMMGVFNLAHGELVLLGAVTVYLVYTASGSVWLGVAGAPLVVGAFGVVMEWGLIRRLYGRPMIAILATWSLGIAIRGLVSNFLGSTAQSVPYPLTGTLTLGVVNLHYWRGFIILVTCLLVVGLYLLLDRTRVGALVRATLENPDLAQLAGVRTPLVYTTTFGFGAALAGLAGALIVPLSSLYAELGANYLIQSFLSILVGGFGTFAGPVVGAGLVSGIQGVSRYIVSPAIADLLVFGLVAVLMRFRPEGLRSS